MMLKIKAKLFLGMLFMICFLSTANAEQDKTQKMCEKELQPSRQTMLTKLESVEKYFVDMKWNFTKYREITYKPLWEVKQMMKDKLSIGRSAEGEVLYNRYEHSSEIYYERAEEYGRLMFERLDEMKREIYTFNQVCAAWGFLDCFEMWSDQFKAKLKELEILLRDHMGSERRLADMIKDALHESPSEHYDYGGRFVDYVTDWERVDYPNFLVLMRSVKEKLEYSWPGEKCCLYCEEGAVYYAKSSLSTELKADPEASFGVRGGVVGRANINEAFEAMYEESDENEEEFEEEDLS